MLDRALLALARHVLRSTVMKILSTLLSVALLASSSVAMAEQAAPAKGAPAKATPSDNPADVFGARLVPATRDGAVIGFKVFAIKADGPFGKIGFHNGDLLTAVNGRAFDEQALVAWKGKGAITFTVERDKKVMELVRPAS